MMNFRTIKNAVGTILTNSAAGRYTVAGFQKQTKSANEVIDNSRIVQVYYSRGMFPKSGGSMRGNNDHDITIKIDFTVSKAAAGDIATLNNANATPLQIQVAMEGIAVAGNLADDSLDELFDIVYQVIMDARNIELGLDSGIVSNRWITDFQKDSPLPRGELLVLTGSCNLTCKTNEIITGQEAVDATAISTDFSIDGNLGDSAGVIVDPSNP